MDFLISLLRKHFGFEALLAAPTEEHRRNLFNEQKVSRKMRIFMGILKVLPWICGAGFVLSFFPFAQTPWTWKLPASLAFIAGSETVTFAGVVSMISVSGLIGYGTNWLAIKMLFRPLEKRPIWGQGLIPAQRDVIVHSLAQGMHKHILSQELILKRMREAALVGKVADTAIDGAAGLLRDPEALAMLAKTVSGEVRLYVAREDAREQLRTEIEARLEENLDSGLKKLALQTYKRVQRSDYEQAIDRLIDQIPTLMSDAILKLAPELDRLAAQVEQQKERAEEFMANAIGEILYRVDITGLLKGQMQHFDERKLERMIWDATNEQLLYIQYLGALLGMLGGLLIWQPRLCTVGAALLLGALWVVDEGIFRLRKRQA